LITCRHTNIQIYARRNAHSLKLMNGPSASCLKTLGLLRRYLVVRRDLDFETPNSACLMSFINGLETQRCLNARKYQKQRPTRREECPVRTSSGATGARRRVRSLDAVVSSAQSSCSFAGTLGDRLPYIVGIVRLFNFQLLYGMLAIIRESYPMKFELRPNPLISL
jgi:hypothetical protein